jgi:hypothetical protein
MPGVSEPETPTYRWVADRGTAWSAAYALTRFEVGRPRFRLFAVVVLVGLPGFLVAAGQGGTAFLLLMGIALAAFLLGASTLISVWGRRNRFRHSLPAGLELTTRFGPDFFVVQGRWSEARVQFRGYDRIDVVEGWLVLRQRERRVRMLYPLALFPADDLARLRLTILGLDPVDGG